ncbi:hypothetical protein [Flavivirga spongiicola]|uniref:Uncharacterized protein n=1 Tax=Flavivirga spongiicola TaxID=421621 RepID=A0ABU7XMF7_9FLAO|nr:hypothetical protein [Flavivirga sp. MEBiC05379]MDO5981272.1 hypothetical protein [Flavivirga sp. MEBiC05379]
MTSKIKPLKEIEDKLEFWKGTRFRQYQMGLNVSEKEDDYYEYMLAEIPGERDFMLLTCVEGYESGSALALVKTSEDKTKFVITGKAIKYSMGIENTYLMESE